ncbi:MAG: BrnT family toxin [Caldilineales bacterium]|nr:BrnT family toxin [Caldilineales bacterium]
MNLEWDELKRQTTLFDRGLDFADAEVVFGGTCLTMPDTRKDYGESRYITLGDLQGRLVVIAWTWRDDNIRIISMRKANEREIKAYQQRLEQG